MLVVLDIAAALAVAYAGLVMAIYTNRVGLCAAVSVLLVGAIIYLTL